MARKRGKRPTGEDVGRAAAGMIGTPYHLRGRVPGSGLDCLGVVVLAHRAAGIPINEVCPTYRAVARIAFGDLGAIRKDFVRIRPDPRDGVIGVRPGDVVLWKLGPQAHLGVVADDDAGDLAVVSADDSDGFGVVTIAPLGLVDRIYRHRSLI